MIMCQRQASSRFLSLVLMATLVLFAASGAVQAADYIGVYAGGHEAAGMGGNVTYTYSLELKADATYEINSYFVMGDALYEFIESGSYVVDGSKLTITPEGQDAIEGAFNSDGTISIGIKPSQMARTRTDATLTPSNNAVAGVYSATLQGPTVVEATLYLDHQGQYHYMAVPGNDTAAVYENGFYTVSGTELAFKVSDSDVTFVGSIQDEEITAPFVVSAMMGMRMEITLEK